MSLHCPHCSAKLPAWRVFGKFSCPSCGRRLKVHALAAQIATVLLWALAEVPLRMAYGMRVDTELPPGFYLVSVVLGLAIAAIMFSLFTAVTLDEAQDGGKDGSQGKDPGADPGAG